MRISDWSSDWCSSDLVIKKRTTPATSPSPQMGVSAEAKHKGGVKEQNVQELDDVIVVGSRLGTSPVESAMPIKVINREQIDRSGAGNLAQVLSYLSDVSVNNNGDISLGLGNGIGGGGKANSTTVQIRAFTRAPPTEHK